MFKISQSSSYKWPVTVEIPANGKTEKHTFDAEFKRLSQSRLEEISDGLATDAIKNDTAVAREVLVGWAGVQDDNGDEIPFSEGARDRLLDVALVSGAVAKAFFESLSGGRRKN